MNDLEFCKQRLLEIAENAVVESLQLQVAEFLEKRLPVESTHRAELKLWATTGLTRLERVPGSGTSRIVSDVAETGRLMAMFQTVISVIEAVQRRSAAG